MAVTRTEKQVAELLKQIYTQTQEGRALAFADETMGAAGIEPELGEKYLQHFAGQGLIITNLVAGRLLLQLTVPGMIEAERLFTTKRSSRSASQVN